MANSDEHVKGGPANHGSGTDLDAPTPPGGPMRQDAADADVNPSGVVDPGPREPAHDPDVEPGAGAEQPRSLGSPPAPPPTGEPADQHPTQDENAEASVDQPSDGSGGE